MNLNGEIELCCKDCDGHSKWYLAIFANWSVSNDLDIEVNTEGSISVSELASEKLIADTVLDCPHCGKEITIEAEIYGKGKSKPYVEPETFRVDNISGALISDGHYFFE